MSPVAQPFFLDVDGQPVSACWHPAASGAARVGVVMCPAWGREETSSHGPWRQWAQKLADAGWPCLRIDYPGEGDAWGRPEEASRMAAWVRSAVVAAEQLKALSGVDHVCMMGLRWGAMVAWSAAQSCPLVRHVLAVAPVVRGRAYVRELAALQAASSGDDEAWARLQGFQSGGFVLHAEEAARWSAMDVSTLADGGTAAIERVTVLDRDDLPAADKWVAQLGARGLAVASTRLPGYADMMADPHLASLPAAWVQASLDALEGVPHARQAAVQPEALARLVDRALMAWQPLVAGAGQDGAAPETGSACMIEERFVRLPDTPVAGVLSRAPDAPPSGHAVLLLNAGSTHHIGTSRLWVELARDWAAEGHLVLRLDLAGLGDSDPHPGRPANQTYPLDAVADVRVAVQWLRQQAGVQRVVAGGLCAGGYHALAAVRAGVRLDAVLMINPLIYMNAEGLDLSAQSGIGAHQAQSAMSVYRQALLSPRQWLKLFSHVALWKVVWQVVHRRVSAVLAASLRALTRALGLPLRNDLARVMRDAMGAGVHVHFYFSPGDPGLPLLKEELGSWFDRLSRRPQWHFTLLDSGDHVFTRWSDRMALLKALLRDAPGVR
jgi:dienelactone hydrolase